MFRQTTYVTASPERSARRASAARDSSSTSGPRALSSASASASLNSRPRSLRSSARENGDETAPASCGRRPFCQAGGGSGLVPANQVPSSRASPSPSEAASAAPRTSLASQRSASRR